MSELMARSSGTIWAAISTHISNRGGVDRIKHDFGGATSEILSPFAVLDRGF
jgi:hypothetical protein